MNYADLLSRSVVLRSKPVIMSLIFIKLVHKKGWHLKPNTPSTKTDIPMFVAGASTTYFAPASCMPVSLLWMLWMCAFWKSGFKTISQSCIYLTHGCRHTQWDEGKLVIFNDRFSNSLAILHWSVGLQALRGSFLHDIQKWQSVLIKLVGFFQIVYEIDWILLLFWCILPSLITPGGFLQKNVLPVCDRQKTQGSRRGWRYVRVVKHDIVLPIYRTWRAFSKTLRCILHSSVGYLTSTTFT